MSAILREKYLADGLTEETDFPKFDWVTEASNGDTVLGYWEWLLHKLEDRGIKHPTLYIKVEGDTIRSVAIRGVELEGPAGLEVVVHDVDDVEAGGLPPQLLEENDGNLPDDFLHIW